MPLENITFGELLSRTARKYPDHPAVWHGGSTVSYAQLEAAVRLCARRFLALGVKRGDRAAVLTDPNLEGITAMYALMYIGAAAAMLNTSLSVPELLTMLGQTRPRLLLLGHSEREQDGFAPRFAGVDMPSSIEHTVLLERGAGALPLLTDLPCAPETELDTAYNGRTILPRRRMTASALPCRCIIAFVFQAIFSRRSPWARACVCRATGIPRMSLTLCRRRGAPCSTACRRCSARCLPRRTFHPRAWLHCASASLPELAAPRRSLSASSTALTGASHSCPVLGRRNAPPG